MARKSKAQKANFFVRFWHGELSLPMSYWGVGLGIGIVFGFSVGIFIGIQMNLLTDYNFITS